MDPLPACAAITRPVLNPLQQTGQSGRCGPLDIFDDLLAGCLGCLSHRPLLGGYDEQQTLS